MPAKPKRACGICTACCKTHEVLSIQKPWAQWCQHCEQGVGCKIYEAKPSECTVFRCQWLFGSFDADDRPDLSGAVVDYAAMEIKGQKIPALFETIPGSLNWSFARKTKKSNLLKGLPVLSVFLDGRKVLRVPVRIVLTEKQKEWLAERNIEVKTLIPAT